MMTRRIPDARFQTRVRIPDSDAENPFDWKEIQARELFENRRVVLFALPGAFTPTCSSTHLPRFEELHDQFRAAGIDDVYCLSVNDAFVMFQWGRSLGIEKVKMLPDGSGEFTRKMGMLVDKNNLGFGMRSWRYSMVVNDGEIEQMFIEEGYSDNCPTDPFAVSDADTVLAWLRDESAPVEKPTPIAFTG